MSFGWYQELLEEVRVADFSAAEAKLVEMLDRGGMIVHAYRETDAENPELVGRHRRLRSFNANGNSACTCQDEAVPHEVERFLLDRDSFDLWASASETNGVVENRWSIVDLWPVEAIGQSGVYGKALLISQSVTTSEKQ
jgi:hypothetical protein